MALQMFRELTTKFLFINCNDVNDCTNNLEELNSILNELIGLDYRKGVIVDSDTAVRLMHSFANISPKEDTLVVKACCLIVSLVSRQKVPIPAITLRKIIKWLLNCLNEHFDEILGDVLNVLRALAKDNAENLKEFHEAFIYPKGLLIMLLHNPKLNQNSYEAATPEEVQLSALLCLEVFLSAIALQTPQPTLSSNCTLTIGRIIMQLSFETMPKTLDDDYFALMHTSLLHIMRHICVLDKSWALQNVGRILGAAQSLMAFPIMESSKSLENWKPPQVVSVSQQAISEQPPTLPGTNKGGKVAKTRKPRTVASYSSRKSQNNGEVREGQLPSSRSEREGRLVSPDGLGLSSFLRTIESEFSELDMQKWRHDVHKKSKMRLAALSLIGQLAKTVETQIFFGYWHVIFPITDSANSSNILQVAIRDPTDRCRMAAFQATSLILYGSRPYLGQASNLKESITYTPFTETLAIMITRMYNTLGEALSKEHSLLVVTQILKCLTVLIQATPFHRLKPGIVKDAARHVRRLVHNKDITIVVAALKTLDFLVSVPEMTPDIAECCGIDSPLPNNSSPYLHPNRILDMLGDFNIEEEDADEEEVAEDVEEGVVCSEAIKDVLPSFSASVGENSRMPWLLQVILEFLGVTVCDRVVRSPSTVLHIKIESLQLLSSIGKEFSIIREYCVPISQALKYSFNDSQTEIRLFAARCLDHIAYTMNNSLMSPNYTQTTVKQCLDFWIEILPSLTAQVQDPNQNSILKSSCCDCLSNINVRVYELLPRPTQMHLISLLSGSASTGENAIRASSVRALAMFVFFPSLREDLCFVENTAEYIINLLSESSLFCRIKGSWALANFTDAFVAAEDQKGLKTIPSVQIIEKINDVLLQRLLVISVAVTSENDKVKCNAVRAIGNLLRLIEPHHMLDESWQTVSMKAINTLEQTSKIGNNMKVKWNSCYALGNCLKNESMFNETKSFSWSKSLYATLCHVMVHCPNYKVRINAASALTQPAEKFELSQNVALSPRSLYGSSFMIIWEALLEALEQAENLTDFNEYKHRDNLVDQIIICMAYFLGTARSPEDYSQLHHSLTPYADVVKRNWSRSYSRASSLKMNIFVRQVKNMSECETKRFSADQAQSLAFLISTFDLHNSFFGEND